MKLRAWLTAVVFLTSFITQLQAEPEPPVLPEGGIRLGDTKLFHLDAVVAIGFSPNGELLASADAKGRIRLWSCTTGELRREFPEATGTVFAFSPDGKYLAAAGAMQKGEIG